MLRQCLLLTAIFPGIAWGCEPWSDEFRNNNELRIGEITLDVSDVFDQRLEAENQTIHQLANKLHKKSRESLIREQLLFAQGDGFDFELLAETARNLRSNNYLRNAEVTPTSVCEEQVNVLVKTGDNWSLIPGFNFSREGGENEFEFSLSELNLFGRGKNIGIKLDLGRDRDQRVLQYFDPRLLGSDIEFGVEVQNNSDGEVQSIAFEKPFRSLDTRSSWRVAASNLEFLQNLYGDGFRVNQLAVDNESISIRRGLSTGRKLAFVQPDGKPVYRIARLSAGWQYTRRKLAATELFPNSTPVAERVFSYPFVEFSFLQPSFITQSNLQVMESVEDVNVGQSLTTRIGFAPEAFGSSEDTLQAEVSYRRGLQLGERFIGLINTGLDGFYTDDGIQNGIASATLEGFYFMSRKTSLFASANFVATKRLFENNQVVLGGATGVRGYPVNFQSGSRRARVTLEQRYFFDWYPFRLARVGSAAFFDAGAAWDKDEDPELLSDVGFGLRIVGTRQANAKVLHIDFAFPLNETDRIDRFQFVVSAKTQF